MLKEMFRTILAIVAVIGASTATAANVSLVNGSDRYWAEACQQFMSLKESSSVAPNIIGECPITPEFTTKWASQMATDFVSYSDRLTSRDMPEWSDGLVAATLSGAGEALGATSANIEIDRMPQGYGKERDFIERVMKNRVSGNANLPVMQQKSTGLTVIAGNPQLEVTYDGEVFNPNPFYEGNNPLKQLGAAMQLTGDSGKPFSFDGVARLNTTVNLYLFDPQGRLLDVREASASAVTPMIHWEMADIRLKDADRTASYQQMMEIKKQGYASTPSADIEDNRYDAFKTAFGELEAGLADAAQAVLNDADAIREAAGL